MTSFLDRDLLEEINFLERKVKKSFREKNIKKALQEMDRLEEKRFLHRDRSIHYFQYH